jgi:peroxiredoxin
MSKRGFLRATLGVAAAVAAIVAAGPLAAAAATPGAPAMPGRRAPAFEVADTTGRPRTLAEFKGKVVVLEWSSPSCPFAAAQYKSGRMQALQRWSKARGIVWLTVLSSHPSRSDYLPARDAQAFNRKRGGVPSALLIDDSGRMGQAYGAATADHMFVIAADGTLAYAGGIDDSESMDVQEVAAP